jgi:hypothetical protein
MKKEDKMENPATKAEVISNVLIHLHHSVVVGTLDSIAIILRMKLLNETMNPRHKDLRELYDTLGSEGRRLFYDAVAAIAEFAVYGTLDFIERYNRFESEENRNEYPSLSLLYNHVVGKDMIQQMISQFGSDELGKSFKRIARNDQIRVLVDATIKNIIDAGPSK